MLSRDLHVKTVYKKVVVMFALRKKAKYTYASFNRGQGCQSVLGLNERIFFLLIIKSMVWSDDEKGKPLCAWAYNVVYFKVSGGRYKEKKRVLRFLRPFHKRLPSKRNVKAHSLTQRQVFITAH